MARLASPNHSKCLSLYRKCLRSAYRIPEADQRLTYLSYTRQGFRDKQNLDPESRHAVLAFKDAEEQLERMDYYHSIREEKMRIKQQQQQQQQQEAIVSVPDSTKLLVNSDFVDDRAKMIRQWLHEAIPDLHDDDTNQYIQQLIEDGFDTLTLLLNELLIEDLVFMKKGHKRAVVKKHLASLVQSKVIDIANKN